MDVVLARAGSDCRFFPLERSLEDMNWVQKDRFILVWIDVEDENGFCVSLLDDRFGWISLREMEILEPNTVLFSGTS